MRKIFTLTASLLVLTGCATGVGDYSETRVLSQKDRDYAACKYDANQASYGATGLMSIAIYKEAMDNCMAAHGYGKVKKKKK